MYTSVAYYPRNNIICGFYTREGKWKVESGKYVYCLDIMNDFLLYNFNELCLITVVVLTLQSLQIIHLGLRLIISANATHVILYIHMNEAHV